MAFIGLLIVVFGLLASGAQAQVPGLPPVPIPASPLALGVEE